MVLNVSDTLLIFTFKIKESFGTYKPKIATSLSGAVAERVSPRGARMGCLFTARLH
jgi:hypothetical protein